jgi:hypothetical protein
MKMFSTRKSKVKDRLALTLMESCRTHLRMVEVATNKETMVNE